LKKKSIHFEKKYISLVARTGRKISATAFAKGYFKMASLTDEGKILAKVEMVCCVDVAFVVVSLVFLTYFLLLSFEFDC
jgi:hypothetical protein